MLARLLALFLIVPIAEIALLVQLGRRVGLLPTLLLVVGTALAGAVLARREGLRTLWQIRSELQSGRFPVGRLLDGILILLAGAFLLTPGVLTDVAGIALLHPRMRGWVKSRLAARVGRLVESGRTNVTIYYDPPV